MSTLVAGAVVATAMMSSCSWNSPGRNPYRGSVREAVSRYIDIPAPVRAQLIAKIERGQPDDRAAITRDSIVGKYDYASEITDVHFGQRTICASVNRDEWPETAREPAAVYCVEDQCLIVPQTSGNISRVRRTDGSGATADQPPVAGQATLAPPARPGEVRSASADDVAMADAVAQAVGMPGSGPGASFTSPFGAASRAPDLADRTPGAGTELTQPSPVPEPATIGLLAAGLAVVLFAVRRRGRGN